MKFSIFLATNSPFSFGVALCEPSGGPSCTRAVALFLRNFEPHRMMLALLMKAEDLIVDLSKVKHLPLDNLATPATPMLYHAPIAMVFAIFDPCVAP